MACSRIESNDLAAALALRGEGRTDDACEMREMREIKTNHF